MKNFWADVRDYLAIWMRMIFFMVGMWMIYVFLNGLGVFQPPRSQEELLFVLPILPVVALEFPLLVMIMNLLGVLQDRLRQWAKRFKAAV